MISCKSLGNNNYADLYFDFRTSGDVSRFQARTNIPLENATIIHVVSYIATKRLRPGCYYAIDVDIFREAAISWERQESMLIAYTVTIDNNNRPPHDEIFLSHVTLDTEELRIKNSAPIGTLPYIPMNGNLKVVVFDVGQANYNEVCIGNKVVIVYDAGAPYDWDRTTVEQFFSKRKTNYKQQDKPLLVISHWDYDHIHCLKGLDANELRNTFCGVVFPDRPMSHTAKKLAEEMQKAFHNRVWNIKTKKLFGVQKYEVELLKSQDLYSLYVGRSNSRNINYNGLILSINSGHTQTVLTGDCCITQLFEAIKTEISRNQDITTNNIVVPHHGGISIGPKGIFSCIPNRSYSTAAYSYGLSNVYGHPAASTKQLLNCYKSHPETAKVGDVVITHDYDV